MPNVLYIGGLVALGFDVTGEYLLTVSHSGRGVFATSTWERLARDHELAYPDDGKAVGIGPIADQVIPVMALDSTGMISIPCPGGNATLHCESSGIEIIEHSRN